MTRTFATSAAALDAEWIAIITIEGSGSGSTLYRYCSQVPSYGDSTYRPWLLDWPAITGEEVDALGGYPINGELEIRLLDYGDALTSEWRTEADPTTYLTAALTSSGTTANVASESGLSSILYVGNEACTISATGSGTATITRAVLDTDATSHEIGTPVYVRLPYLRGRRMRLYLVNKDAASSSEETLIATYAIDQVALTDDLNGWVLRGKTALRWFDRLVCRAYPRTASGAPFIEGQIGACNLVAEPDSDALSADLVTGVLNWPSGYVAARIVETGEVVLVDWTFPRVVERGLCRTQVQPIPVPCTLAFVFPAENGRLTESTFFRWSSSSSSSRSSGFTASAHWIDIILNLALSSADAADGLELNNRNTTYGAWDCLPIGVGIGIPHAQIDWSAAMGVRARTPDFIFPAAVIGDQPEPFADLVARLFLKPIGAYFSTASGTARIVLPSIGAAGASSVAIGPSSMLGRVVAAGLANDTGAALDMAGLPTSITYTLADGNKLTANNEQLAKSNYYATTESTIEIDALGAISNGASNRTHFLMGCGTRRIFRARRPAWVITPPVGSSVYASAVGDAVAITHPDLPDLSTGARGWTSVYGEIARVTPHLDPDRGYWHAWEVRSFGPNVRPGKIAPAGRIASIASAGGGQLDVTISANRYAQSDATAWPATDAAGFAVGDVLGVYSRAGVAATASTATIVSITSNVLRLSGTMGGTLAAGTGNAGQVLRYAPSASAATAQLDGYVYWADQAARTIGATTRRPWQYGEP